MLHCECRAAGSAIPVACVLWFSEMCPVHESPPYGFRSFPMSQVMAQRSTRAALSYFEENILNRAFWQMTTKRRDTSFSRGSGAPALGRGNSYAAHPETFASLDEGTHILLLSPGPAQKPDVNLTGSRIAMNTSGYVCEELSRLGQLRGEKPP